MFATAGAGRCHPISLPRIGTDVESPYYDLEQLVDGIHTVHIIDTCFGGE